MNLELYLEQMKELVNIDSGSGNVAGINRVADKLAGWYQEIGWNVERIPADGGRQVLLITNHVSEHYDAMYIGHMDTVFPDGTAEKRPFRIEGENYYGPGVGDMKNGDLAMFHIAANLPETEKKCLNIAMVYNPDEEIGSIYSKEITDRIGCQADHIFVMESAGKNGTRHCFARKGSLTYDIEFQGQAAHAGFMFEVENASAVLEMGHYIVELMSLADREKDTTVNVGIANGGTARNVVADHAKISVEMRFRDDSERIRLKEYVNKITEGQPFVPGVKTTITMQKEIPPFIKTEEAKKYIERVRKIAEEYGIPFEEKDRGGLSDANHLSRCGNAIVMDGMGPHGANDHSEKEYGYIGSVEPCVKLHLAILNDMLNKQ